MDVTQITEGLRQALFVENHRIVFWYDAAGDFAAEIPTLPLVEVNTINMANTSALAVKMRLELEDTESKFLLYFPFAEPEIEKDWLLDIKLYSRCFYADRMSIIFNELGLQQQSVRAHLAKRERFLGSKSRLATLKSCVQPEFDEVALDLAMIATITKADSCDLQHILFALAEEQVQGDLGLEANPPSLEALAKYQLAGPLARALQQALGYPATAAELNGEATLHFGHLLIRLLVTGYCEGAATIPSWAAGQVLTAGGARATCQALLSRWRDSSRYYQTFDVVSDWVATALNIEAKLEELTLPELAQIEMFKVAERRLVIELVQAIPGAERKQLDEYEQIIRSRLDKHWATRHKDDETRRFYRSVYAALVAAIQLFDLRRVHTDGFHFESVAALYSAYETDLYQFDTAYRHYVAATQSVHLNILKPLDEAVEQCYAQWYIDNLAKNWGDKIEAEQRLSAWYLPEVTNQQAFFATQVQPLLEKGGARRVAVIISDAFRYEAAVELQDRINEKRYSEATLGSQLGVVPSYTTLGMAALLPHESLEYREANGDDVFVDGQSSKGRAAREKILTAHGGLAITADQLKAWTRDAGREALKDQQLVYVYHNVVDARGDSASTESGTFDAVEDAIEELTELTRKILLNFNISTVLVTADHGFLFQQSAPDEVTRTSIAEKPDNTLKYKKRYVIGSNLPAAEDVWAGSTQQTAGTMSATDFWIPKGANRFHFVGGARFMHGGIMPQEIVVPVLTVKALRGEKAEKRTRRKVGVMSTKSSMKMTNNIQKFELMQTEAVSELVLPISVALAIFDGDKLVSSEEVVSFDSASDSVAERMKSIRLSLEGTNFDRKKDYFLVLKDKDLNTEIERYKMTIDLAITDDFF